MMGAAPMTLDRHAEHLARPTDTLPN